MLHVGDGNVGAHHLADLAGVAARRVHHVLADHAALVRDHFPVSGLPLLDVEHLGAGCDARAHVARALAHGIADAGRVDVAVVQRPGPRQHAVQVDPRIELTNLGGIDNLAVETHQLGDAGNMVKPVHLGLVQGEADSAAAVPAYVLAGQCLQLGVQAIAVVVDFRHVVIGDKARALSRCMPGRARRQLAFLDQ